MGMLNPTHSLTHVHLIAPCGLRGCKNGPAPFPGRMSYKATKPGLVFGLDALAKAWSAIATATWLAGWLAGSLGGWVAVTLRYCIKTAKPIGKLFRPSESPIILVF